MGHLARLQSVARITYYIGWLSLVCGAFLHINIGRALFMKIDLTQRNLFEVSVVCFLICAASELRALAATREAAPGVVKKMAA